MSDDLVKRLRQPVGWADEWGPMCIEAADRIEKLENQFKLYFHAFNKAASRIEQLEAALRTVKEEHGYGLPLETTRMIDAVLEGQK